MVLAYSQVAPAYAPAGGGLRPSCSLPAIGRKSPSLKALPEAARPGSRTGHLARAGWSIISPKAPPPALEVLAPSLEAEGERLVQDVASLWGSKYQHHIRSSGAHEGAFHYECIFSCPTDAAPVPSVIINTQFALVVPQFDDKMCALGPRLLFSFEEGDLRHEWGLRQDADGSLRIATGQQISSLQDGIFESYLDQYIREKETVRSQGICLRTPFEDMRLLQPAQAPSEDGESVVSEEYDAHSAAFSASVATVSANLRPMPVDADGEPKRRGTNGRASLPSMPEEAEPEMAHTMKVALKAAGLACDGVPPPTSLAELLANIFDAADEDDVGALAHFEVARLLGATLPGFSLEEWDIHLLLTSAQESPDGMIECKPFIQAAPEIVYALRKRRLAFVERGLPGVEISIEAVKHCFGDEVSITSDCLMRVFEQYAQDDPDNALFHCMQPLSGTKRKTRGSEDHAEPATSKSSGARRTSVHNGQEGEMVLVGADCDEKVLVALRRRCCRECINSNPERVSPQEAQRLMQMLPEDENGFCYLDDLPDRLEMLRAEALLNALVETDLPALRTHLVLRFRHLIATEATISEDGKMKIWDLKHALLQADQLCLSRLHIHILLCLSDPAPNGDTDVNIFLAMCCVVIPHMFDAKLFVGTAERLQIEHAESMKRSENAELAALAKAPTANTGDGEEKKSQETEVDQDTVERTLIGAFQINDDTHRNPPSLPPEAIVTMLYSGDAQVQSCQLSDYELCGFAAEMSLDQNGEVAYMEHVKRWVPIIFELRKNQLLGAYIQEKAAETLGIPEPNLKELDAILPLLASGVSKTIHRRPSKAVVDPAKDPKRRKSLERRSSCPDSTTLLSRRMSNRASAESVPSKEVDSGDEGQKIDRSQQKLRTSMIGGDHRARLHAGGGGRAEGGLHGEDPPPGRGYARRKARLQAESDNRADEKPVERRSGSKSALSRKDSKA